MKIFTKTKRILQYNRAFVLGIFCVLLACAFLSEYFVKAQADWYHNDWGYRRSVIVDFNYVEGDLSNFPVLVHVSDESLRNIWMEGNVGKSNGGDILFTTGDGTTKIPHELEYYSSLDGEVVAWVKIPNVSASGNTEIFMYYGNEEAADQWDLIGAVWSNDFSAVYHLSDNCDTLGCYIDAANPSGGNHGSTYDGDSLASLHEGYAKIVSGLDFDGNNDYMRISDAASLDLTDSFSVEAWVLLTELNRYNTIFDKGAYGLKISPDKKYNFYGRTSETAAQWEEVFDFGTSYTATSMAIFNNNLYVTLEGNGVNSKIFSSPNGSSYTSVKTFPGSRELGGLTTFKNELYVFEEENLLKASDGLSWGIIYTAPEMLRSMAVFNNYLFLGTKTGGKIYRSLTGSAWSEVEDFSDLDMADVFAMTVFEGELYVGGDKGRLFRTSNGTDFTLEYDFGSGNSIESMGVFNRKLFVGVDEGTSIETYYKTGVGTFSKSSF